MLKSDDPANRRRFQRVVFDRENPTAQAIPGVKAVWLNENKVPVFDFSYTGAALGLPQGVELKNNNKYQLKIEFENAGECRVDAEVIWFNDHTVGVAFGDLSSEARLIINNFLDDKLIGANLTEVSKDLYAEVIDCDHWFRGPQETNVMMWLSDGSITTLKVELMDQDHFVFEGGKILSGKDLLPRVADIISQIESWREKTNALLTQLKGQR